MHAHVIKYPVKITVSPIYVLPLGSSNEKPRREEVLEWKGKKWECYRESLLSVRQNRREKAKSRGMARNTWRVNSRKGSSEACYTCLEAEGPTDFSIQRYGRRERGTCDFGSKSGSRTSYKDWGLAKPFLCTRIYLTASEENLLLVWFGAELGSALVLDQKIGA